MPHFPASHPGTFWGKIWKSEATSYSDMFSVAVDGKTVKRPQVSQQLSSASRKMPPAVLLSSVQSLQLSVSHDLPSAEVPPGNLSPLDA